MKVNIEDELLVLSDRHNYLSGMKPNEIIIIIIIIVSTVIINLISIILTHIIIIMIIIKLLYLKFWDKIILK